MTHFLRTITIAFGCALVLAGCNSEPKISAGQLKDLVLSTSDLPARFQAFYDGPTVKLDTQGTPRQDPKRYGRKGGWVARFNRPGSAATTGPLVVTSAVDVFGDSGGAKADFAAYRRQFERQAGHLGSSRLVQVRALGNDAVGVKSLQPGLNRVLSFTIAWRDRNATASITANGFEGKLLLGDVIGLARRQERKLAKPEQ